MAAKYFILLIKSQLHFTCLINKCNLIARKLELKLSNSIRYSKARNDGAFLLLDERFTLYTWDRFLKENIHRCCK